MGRRGDPERFAAYCGTVLGELGPLIPYACTINEANIGEIIRRAIETGEGRKLHRETVVGLAEDPAAMGTGTQAPTGRPRPPKGIFLFTFSAEGHDIIGRAHTLARDAIRRASPATKVGITLALQDMQAQPGGEKEADEIWARQFTDFLPVIDGDDFIGVQNYSRIVVGPDGEIPAAALGSELTQMGYEFYPQALEGVLRRAAGAGLPLFVTENGIATTDDTRRTEFIRLARGGVERALADGIDVGGYFYWSALDNFEWMLGYRGLRRSSKGSCASGPRSALGWALPRQDLVVEPVEGRGPGCGVDADDAPGEAAGDLGGEVAAVQFREHGELSVLLESEADQVRVQRHPVGGLGRVDGKDLYPQHRGPGGGGQLADHLAETADAGLGADHAVADFNSVMVAFVHPDDEPARPVGLRPDADVGMLLPAADEGGPPRVHRVLAGAGQNEPALPEVQWRARPGRDPAGMQLR